MFRDNYGSWEPIGGVVWGQDEINIVEDLIAGWDDRRSKLVAEVEKANRTAVREISRL